MSSTTITTVIDRETLLLSQKEPIAQNDQTSPTSYKLRATANWVKKPFKERNIWERLATLDLASKKCYKVQPPNPNAPPTHSVWTERGWLASMIIPALVIHAAWYCLVPKDSFFHTWHPAVAYVYYEVAFIVFLLMLVKHLHYYMKFYGTFDEHKRPRDYVPDKLVFRLVISVIIYTLARTASGFILGGYDRNAPPSLGHTISWLFPIKIGLWLIALDFFFYAYHRTVHSVPFLWKFHSMHHNTKHPTLIQSILAGNVQEIIEVFLIPPVTTLIVPLSVHEFWIAQCILMYVEATGHSGIRAYWTHPILSEVLQPFKMELCIEDHELHHRYGKSGMNYGKQTRIFDRFFGTLCERVECVQKQGGWAGPDTVYDKSMS